jgi:hypothetical protein
MAVIGGKGGEQENAKIETRNLEIKKALWSDLSDQYSKAPFLPHLCR